MTPADYCRSQGWQVGDVLESANGHLWILITAIAVKEIMIVFEPATPPHPQNIQLELQFVGHHPQHCIDITSFHRVGHMDPFADKLVWPETK